MRTQDRTSRVCFQSMVPEPVAAIVIRVLVLMFFMIGGSGQTSAQENALLTIRIVDGSGELTAARAWVDCGGERFFTPEKSESVTVYDRDRSFSCDGVFAIEVPAGEAVVHVEKGKEFTPVDVAVSVEPGAKVEKTISIERWIDMPSEGWYSADLHVHLGHDSPRILKQLALADDVHLVPAFTYWLRGRGETWNPLWPRGINADTITADQNHLITRNHIEIERINRDAVPGGIPGATFLFNLEKPVTTKRNGEHFPTDAALCREARIHSPKAVFDSDKPSWAETVVGAALGQLDTVQLCHNHFHRNSTISGGWGMIGPMAPGESNAAAGDGLFHRTNDLYYRFLNCGFRLGVSGGSAIGVMPVPTGFHRVYARIEGPLTAAKMWESIKAGRSFATTGPILTLTADGHGMGATIEKLTTDASSIEVRARVRSIEGLEAIEIIQNGRVVASRDLREGIPNPILDEEMVHELLPKRSGWVAARALFRSPGGLLRQAHTSPIYLSIDEKPVAFAEDAGYMIRWIERLEEIAREDDESARFPDAEAREEVLADYKEARARYEQIIHDAKKFWGDHRR